MLGDVSGKGVAASMLMAELATCVKYRLPVKVVVVKNNTLGQIKWEQMVFLGNPEYGCDLQPIDFAGVARACGVAGFTIAGTPASSEVASFSSIPHTGKLKALMWTATPSMGTQMWRPTNVPPLDSGSMSPST